MPPSQRTPASVVIADDHAPLRSTLRGLLEQSGFYVCAEVADAAAAIDAAFRTEPDLCLLDIRMPGNGIAAAAAITALLPQVKVVMLTVSMMESDVSRAIEAGACGYLLKDESLTNIERVLRQALAGEALLSGALTAGLFSEFRRLTRQRRTRSRRDDLLTTREEEVLELLADDQTTTEIAGLLGVEEATVRSHVSGILRKYQVRTRQAALRRYRER